LCHGLEAPSCRSTSNTSLSLSVANLENIPSRGPCLVSLPPWASRNGLRLDATATSQKTLTTQGESQNAEIYRNSKKKGPGKAGGNQLPLVSIRFSGVLLESGLVTKTTNVLAPKKKPYIPPSQVGSNQTQPLAS